jgi:hypothetical protein
MTTPASPTSAAPLCQDSAKPSNRFPGPSVAAATAQRAKRIVVAAEPMAGRAAMSLDSQADCGHRPTRVTTSRANVACYGTSGALLFSDDFWSSVERATKLHPLLQEPLERSVIVWLWCSEVM